MGILPNEEAVEITPREEPKVAPEHHEEPPKIYLPKEEDHDRQKRD